METTIKEPIAAAFPAIAALANVREKYLQSNTARGRPSYLELAGFFENQSRP